MAVYCPVCKRGSRGGMVTPNGRYVGAHEAMTLWKCGRCDLRFSITEKTNNFVARVARNHAGGKE